MGEIPNEVTILLSGDAMLGRGVNAVLHTAGPEYPFEPLVPITHSADLFFTNLECAITPQDLIYSGPPKAFCFRADPIAAEALQYAGVDLVSLANNHALDADDTGLIDTIAILEENGIRHAGAGINLAEASRPAIIEAKGVTIGVLAYCDHQPDFAVTAERPGIRYVDLSDPDTPRLLSEEVASFSDQVDHVVVSIHWQPNWVPHVLPFYRSLARDLVSSGASLIWGHSPHHFQGVEWVGKSLVVYSSGGLVDDYALEPTYRNDRQLLFRVCIGATGVERAWAFPIELDYARTYPASAEARGWIERRLDRMCTEVGSRIEKDGEWLEILQEM